MTVFRVLRGSSLGASTRSAGGTRTVTLCIEPQCSSLELLRAMQSVGPACQGEQPRHTHPHLTNYTHTHTLHYTTGSDVACRAVTSTVWQKFVITTIKHGHAINE